jgi:hypothetical protein
VFDLNDPLSTQLKRDTSDERQLATVTNDVPEETEWHLLDKPDARERFGMLLSYYRQELDRQGENRAEQALDAAYYDNDQWTAEEKAILSERGQAALVYNVVATTCNWVIGSEKRGRTDFKILPRGKEDAKPAESKTKFLKYLSDVNRDPFVRSSAFEDQIKVGVGWLETGAQDDDDAEQIYHRHEPWRNMLWDSADRSLDGKGMRYLSRSRWVDEDMAKGYFPERHAAIKSSITDTVGAGSFDMLDGDMAMDVAEDQREQGIGSSSDTQHRRRRLRLIEMWYRMPEMVDTLNGGELHGQPYDHDNPKHRESIALGMSRTHRKFGLAVRVAVFTTSALLYDGPSPYKHKRFPFTPVWGYRRDDNGLPYGMIRNLRPIQDDINKRASKALAILSSNKVIMDDDALPDTWTMDDFADEVAKPNAILVKRRGSEIILDVDRELAPAHLSLMERGISMIQQVGGVTDEQMGKSTNATSGKAILARQEQGSMATAKLFDNLRLAVQLDGELKLSLMEQFVTEQKEFRITNQRGVPEFVTMNDGLPENDITRAKSDFVISEADWRASMRQAASDQLIEMMGKMPPEFAALIFDLVVEGMDVENREEIVKRIRAANGQRDPDATEPTPEELANQQAKAQQDALQQELVQLQIEETREKVAKLRGDTDLTKAKTVESAMSGAKSAMEAATLVIQMPTIARVADGLLMQAGWEGGQPVPTDLPPAAQGIAPRPGPPPALPAPAPEQAVPMPEQQPQMGAPQ